jgi:polar amino acid transport system permease protein
MIELLTRYAPAFGQGLVVTAMLTAIIWTVGIGGGILLGAWARRDLFVGKSLGLVAFVVSALPILVVLMWLHFPAQAILGIVVDPFITTAVALSLVNLILVGDTVGRTIGALPLEWSLAGRTSGLSEKQVFRSITLPLAFRQLIGPVTLIQISMLHATLFGSLISVDELFRTIQRINAIEYRPIELYTLLALFFFLICAPLQMLAQRANQRFGNDISLR